MAESMLVSSDAEKMIFSNAFTLSLSDAAICERNSFANATMISECERPG